MTYQRSAYYCTAGSLALLALAAPALASAPFQATGCKIGEVTHNSAIVWTRLTRQAERNPDDAPAVVIEYLPADPAHPRRQRAVRAVHLDGDATVAGLRQAVPGCDGQVRVRWRPQGESAWQETAWQPVDPLADFTRQVPLTGLIPATAYELEIQSRAVDEAEGATLEARFRTAPAPDQARPVRFTVATCFGNDDQDCPEGFKIFPSMSRLDPDFFVHTGDIIYYDELAKTVDLARYHWQRMFSWPTAVEFYRTLGSYFEKDDHDTWCNDCWPTMTTPYMHEFTFRQGQAVYREQVALGPSTYRTVRWGRDLQLWLVEGRDFRSPNNAPDGPQKTIWGAAQKEWFRHTLSESDATFKVLISPTPLVGPDRSQKNDNHANAGFRHEGDELRQFLARSPNTVVLCGDRHWQYASADPATGLREYSCGPASDEHAGGWQQEDYVPEVHRFLRVAGGFLSGQVERPAVVDGPAAVELVLRLHDVEGQVVFEDRLSTRIEP